MPIRKNVLNKNLILERIKKVPSGCWEWQGEITPTGYGRIRIAIKRYPAHRVSAHLWLGFALDSSLFICHHCDNRRCCNPQHLFAGTNYDNQMDALKKGRLRWRVGQDHAQAKLTTEQVLAIKALYGRASSTVIAKKFGVSPSLIQRIHLGKKWKHIKEGAT